MAALGSKLNRARVTTKDIEKGLEEITQKLAFRLSTKGFGSYASRHEIYGILAEEMKEVLDELQINTKPGYVNFRKELKDVAVAAIFGYICMDQEYIPFVPKKKR